MALNSGVEQQLYYGINKNSTIFLKKFLCKDGTPALAIKLFYPESFLNKESGGSELIGSKREIVIPAFDAYSLAETLLKILPADRSTIQKPNSNFFGDFSIPEHLMKVVYPLEQEDNTEHASDKQQSTTKVSFLLPPTYQ